MTRSASTPAPGPSRNARLSIMRGWLHDQFCRSGCTPSDGEHARRTQHPSARAFVDAATDLERARALHQIFCLHAQRGECPNEEAHLTVALEKVLPKVPVEATSYRQD